MTVRLNVITFSSYTGDTAEDFACNAGSICPIVAERDRHPGKHDGESHSRSDLCVIFKCGNMLQTRSTAESIDEWNASRVIRWWNVQHSSG
jgi:hypothetical protein